MMLIDTKSYKLNKDNYYTKITLKNKIILSGSLRAKNYGIIRNQHKEYGRHKKWAMFTVDRDGKIYQHFDAKYYSDFYGDKIIDKESITISLENMGMLKYDAKKNKYFNWINEECEEENVHTQSWNKWMYWEKYPKLQQDAVNDLCVYLCEEYDIRKDTLGYNVYESDAYDFDGIITRSNLNNEFNDLNPSYDFKKLIKALK